MVPKLTRDEVLRVATLAHLELTDPEIDLFSRQLSDILAYATAVQDADTRDVAPTAHPLGGDTAWREDEPVPSLDRKTVIEQAPAGDPGAGLFKVPKVL